MSTVEMKGEVHDSRVLQWARSIIEESPSHRLIQQEIVNAVNRNAIWRGEECLNLLAPEAPTTPIVRQLLASEVGTRAAEGHIGSTQRWFAGTKYIDEIEALCVELLKKVFHANFADHRLVASMIGNMTVYAALTQPGDTIMTIAQPFGGHSSNRVDGPAGIRGLQIVDVPMDPVELTVDLDGFAKVARQVRPKLVTLGASMTLFPFPLKEMAEIVKEWGGRIYFDGAHQLGLIGGGQFQDPLREGACVMTGSAGKTFSGPQSGIIVWNDPEFSVPITNAIFPALAATHQVNRVAALAAAAAEFLAFGKEYMAQIVTNAQALGKAFDERGIRVLCTHKGYTRTHQVILDVKEFGGGYEVGKRLAEANIITNKNLIPGDGPEDWDFPSGLRIGTTEVTRFGMKEKEMDTIADLIASVLSGNEKPEVVQSKVIELRRSFSKMQYCFPE
ncbi:probable serine hydroxymethyltransferase [Brevibacillus brevis NBRC 100599]|uniref:Probable serine hydroxymethyltransferase n=1 Tax=Brevibacillus brevis (strain 47 / JCM 6285 / NBRC 100599) TaxID=358681 RepID=C0ZD63_BREBN|nr:serine hydroxymethyltransferase [Brevibacillus brevis]BAH43722.1 probable serine hydroxymethyltransferase [Brevibacillus brevis NBRC 100599]